MGLNKGLLLGVISSLSLAACAPHSGSSTSAQIDSSSADNSAIIAGTEVSSGDLVGQSIVGIVSKHAGQQGYAICTGSLLPGNLVLTAAHCLDSYMTVVFASNIDSSLPEQRMPVDKAVASPYWSARKNADKDHGDIALLHFVGQIPAGYAPATFLSDASALQAGTPILLAGYGVNLVTQTNIDVNKYPDLIGAIQDGRVICDDPKNLTNCSEVDMTGAGILRKTSVTVSDAKFAQSEVLLDQTKGSGACHGDSGGPAYVTVNGKLYLWGVTSRGEQDPKNNCSQYAVYTNALFYKSWLNRVAKQLTSPGQNLPATKLARAN